MNKWIRNEAIDEVYYEMHGIRPEISYDRINRDKYSVKIALGGKEVIITETMENGLTDSVVLESQGIGTESFKTMYGAETRANEILRSE